MRAYSTEFVLRWGSQGTSLASVPVFAGLRYAFLALPIRLGFLLLLERPPRLLSRLLRPPSEFMSAPLPLDDQGSLRLKLVNQPVVDGFHGNAIIYDALV